MFIIKKSFTLAAVLVLTLGTLAVYAQQKPRTITGQVRAVEDQQPIAGVSVVVKGTKNISGSQDDGIYYVEVRNTDSTLVFTHPYFEAKEIRLTREREYNVELKKKHH